MPAADDLSQLTDDQWRELEDCADRLEKTLLERPEPADLLLYLPPPGANHRRLVLLELIKTELEALFRRRRGVTLDDYLARYPELGGAANLPASLIYEEYRVRRVFGDQPDLESYRRRFPAQFEALRKLLQTNPLPTTYGTIRPAAGSHRPPRPSGGSHGVPPTTGGGGRTPQHPTLPEPAPDADRVLRSAMNNDSEYAGLPMLSGFQKLERLGRGEFGEVWKARAPGGVEVAIKFILRNLDHDATKRELKALEKIRNLHHPFLLQTHSYGMLEEKLTIVMELADGSLSERYKECKKETPPDTLPGIPVEELVPYFAQAADALDFLHQREVVHRDIKPQNLLMLKGYAKVADFGLAREQDSTMADASVVCGTPHYMAPEVWHQRISKHSDQYSLAATYAEMRMGRRAFIGKTPIEIAEAHLRAEPDVSPLPAAEQAVLRKALAKDPDRRYQSCVEFARALADATAPPPPPPPPAPPASRKLIAALGVGLTAAVIIVCLLVFRTPSTGSGTTTPGTGSPVEVTTKVDWLPTGWKPEGEEIETDKNNQRFYTKISREVGPDKIKVVAVLVRQKSSSDPQTFYMMENKVWNELYAAFVADPRSKELIKRHTMGGNRELLIKNQEEWRKGAVSLKQPVEKRDLGVSGDQRMVPVFRVTVTEAYCFAEWLGGHLPSFDQWLKAIGVDEDPRKGPYDDPSEVAVEPLGVPRPVNAEKADKSVYRCRQMAGNGKEWTRDLSSGSEKTIPLRVYLGATKVKVVGKSYEGEQLLTFDLLRSGGGWGAEDCTMATPDITFRVVLER